MDRCELVGKLKALRDKLVEMPRFLKEFIERSMDYMHNLYMK